MIARALGAHRFGRPGDFWWCTLHSGTCAARESSKDGNLSARRRRRTISGGTSPPRMAIRTPARSPDFASPGYTRSMA